MLSRNAEVTVSVAWPELGNLGTWVSKGGGETEADVQRIRLGGLSPEVALGGPASTGEVTVTHVSDLYLQTKAKALRKAVGLARMSVSVQPLNNDKTNAGPSETYVGILGAYTPPDHDDNEAEVAFVELTLIPDEQTL